MSLQDAYALTHAAGVPLQCCLAYNHMKAKGFIVRRIAANENQLQLFDAPGVLRPGFAVYPNGSKFSKKSGVLPSFHLAVCRFEDAPPLADLQEHMHAPPGEQQVQIGCIVCVVASDGTVLAFEVQGGGAGALLPWLRGADPGAAPS